ncbi:MULTISPECIES: DUF3604 domain-containing protein [Aphanothece]|uniref:DUF3604 domain-containing protein n=1 Tax=Aphanothece TaxID=1121 RepID=UPI0039854874
MRKQATLALGLLMLGLVPFQHRPAAAKAPAPVAAGKATADLPKNAYFGESHLHTAYSLDAYIGGARLTPDGAYRFAKGETVEVNGQQFRLRRPLDWAAVTDHAEFIGEMYSTLVPGAPGHDQPLIQQLRGLQTYEDRENWFLTMVVKSNRGSTPSHPPFYAGEATERSGWQEILAATQRHNEPGRFTTIPAYEWSAAPQGGNLHRNVFFRDMNVPEKVMSYIDINRETGLWAWFQGLERQGMQVLAIPHNANASKGMMFAATRPDGAPIDSAYADIRSHFEPLIEMMQIKGNSEVHRAFWGADEFAGFENADSIQDYSGRTFSKGDFVRDGVIQGLAHEQSLGVNPFKYGFVGGTDNHNGTPGNTAEDNFMAGSHGAADGSVARRRDGEVGGWIKGRDLNPGALTGVWAAANTRADIWDAMKRRETFATSGTRLKVRFFAGWNYPRDLATRADMIALAYRQGVPMGADLPPAKGRAAGSPTFLVWALKDPDGAHLDRIQIIKGWVDAQGNTHETIHDVAWAGQRSPDANGRVPAIGSTVDLKRATYTNNLGAPVLAATWRDPHFDPSVRALYYVRVLEIPTPRWSTYDAVRAGLPLLEGVAATVQERAWSSPIWLAPVPG